MSRQNHPLNIVFAGTPDFARTILQCLADSEFAPLAVLTQPDRPQGRNRKLRPGPVKQLATSLDLPVHQPNTLRDPSAHQLLSQYDPHLLVVAAYGLILPPDVLAIPSYGCLNVHASLLPRWRGAAPIERAIMAGDEQTGVCIMHMEAGLDTGPVYAEAALPIPDPVDSAALESALARRGGELLIDVISGFAAHHTGRAPPPTAVPQDNELATYADKLTAADRVVDWQRSATEIALQINALAARMPVRCQIRGTGVQLLQATAQPDHDAAADIGTLTHADKRGIVIKCATDSLQLTRIRVERGKGAALDPAAALNGFAELFVVGTRFDRIG